MVGETVSGFGRMLPHEDVSPVLRVRETVSGFERMLPLADVSPVLRVLPVDYRMKR